MYIASFHIDGFGIFANAGCDNLSPGLNIFYGQNEAGKSTCLDFFRVMLAGYPEKRDRQKRSFEPLNGGRPGGSLVLHCEEKPYELKISRGPASHGGLRLYGADGESLHGDALARLFSGVDRDVYARIFGFGLDELEQWDRKSDESLRNALYGASFGPGLVSPGMAGEKLCKRMNEIFRAKGAQQPLARALLELERLQGEIEKWRQESAAYDDLAKEIERAQARVSALQLRRQELEEERKRLERRLGQWQNWDQWRSLGAKIERMENIPDNFPEDAAPRLAALQAASANAANNLAAARTRLEQTAARADEIVINAACIGESPELRALAERKSGYRQALARLADLEEAEKSAADDLRRELSRLGPDWTCERIRNTDRSIFAREDMTKRATALDAAQLARQTAHANLATANRAVEEARETIGRIEEELAEIPETVAIMSESERDELRNNMARLEECRRAEPARRRTLENARQAFHRALRQAQIFDENDSESESGISAILDNLVERQEEATSLAGEMRQRLEDAAEARKKIEKAEEEACDLKNRTDEMIAARRAAEGPTRDAIEKRASALRSLRALASSIESEEERKKELEARISEERTPHQVRNWTLVVFSALFLAAAVAIFAAHWFWGIDELAITPEAVIPINLWAAYAALVCGVALFGGAFSGYGPEQKRRKQEYARLLARGEDCAMRLAELGEQARRLCQDAGIESLDPIAMDATEMLLEREKEQLFHEERSRQDIEALKLQLGRVQEKIGELQGEAQKKDTAVQQCRRRWHGLMQSLNITNVPSPESMATVFARAEAARIAEANLDNAQKELDALREDLRLLEASISAMPAIKERLEAPEPPSLEEAVKQALDSCREAEMTRDRRIRLEADLESARKDLARASVSQGAASDQFAASERDLASEKDQWGACVEGLGLLRDMAPDTVREAYGYMQECLDAEERLKRASANLAQARAEIAALESPLQKILAKLEREPQLDANGAPDWLAALDNLLAEAEANLRRAEKLDSLKAALAEQKDEAAALKAALESAEAAEREFLANAGASDADGFLRLARLRDERRSLKSRREDIEIVLEQVAQGESLQQFLASFETGDRDRTEDRLGAIQEELGEIAKEERGLTERAAIQKEKARELANADEPAEMRQKEEMLRESIARMSRQWSELALAAALLKEAKRIFEKERQPQIIREASRLFAEITGGRWTGMSLNLEDSSLLILPPHGDPVAPASLSRGAQEQAYLALRLAYIVKHAESSESLPVIMDEILVNFDPERASRTAEALARMAAKDQQILYFTCQPHIVELLQDKFGESALYKVEKGTIRAA